MSEIMLAHMNMSRNTKEWRLDCKVYVGDLGYGAAKQELEDIFSQYGPLRNVWVARNPPGFAFVEYEDPRDAKDAVRGLNGVKINGRRVRVEMSTGESRWSKRGPPVGRRSSYRDSRPRVRSRSRSPVARRRRSPSPQSVSRPEEILHPSRSAARSPPLQYQLSPSPYAQSASYGRR